MISYQDSLTGLKNRRYFTDFINNIDRRKDFPVTIIIGDVNGLKLVNDAFGHLVGDELLTTTSDIISRNIGKEDVAARWGGDEFTIALVGADIDDAKRVTKKIDEESKNVDFKYGAVSISFGFSCIKSKEDDIHSIFKEAEDLMYQNKIGSSGSIRSDMINTIMTTLFEKSSEIQEHSLRVSKIAAQIAERLNLSDTKINDIRTIGMIHDIGKIVIDLKILDKPGRLNEEAREIINKHPITGSTMLNASYEYSRYAPGVLYHHEKLDGTGYPNGLIGDEIPLEARIISVADAFDAMTAKRVYRPRIMSHDEAKQELLRCSGSQFDPHIVKAFLKIDDFH